MVRMPKELSRFPVSSTSSAEETSFVGKEFPTGGIATRSPINGSQQHESEPGLTPNLTRSSRRKMSTPVLSTSSSKGTQGSLIRDSFVFQVLEKRKELCTNIRLGSQRDTIRSRATLSMSPEDGDFNRNQGLVGEHRYVVGVGHQRLPFHKTRTVVRVRKGEGS